MTGMSLACPRVRRTLLNTGILGVLTTSALVGFGATGALASTSVASASVLRIGSSGSAVTVLQAKLGVAQDGVFGARTVAAVVAFQRARGLERHHGSDGPSPEHPVLGDAELRLQDRDPVSYTHLRAHET